MANIDIYTISDSEGPNMSYCLLQVFDVRDINVELVYQRCHNAQYWINIYNNGFTYTFKIHVTGTLPRNLTDLLPYILLSRNAYSDAIFSENKCHWYCKIFMIFDCWCLSNRRFLMNWRFKRPVGELSR